MNENEQIQKIWRGLPPGDPLRRQAELLQSDAHATIGDIGPVLRALTGRSLFDDVGRAAAVRVAMNANWTEEQRSTITGVLSACVEKEIRTRRPGKLAARWFCRGMVLNTVFWTGCGAMTWSGQTMPDLWLIVLGLLSTSAVFTVLSSFVTAPLSVWYDNWRSLRLVSAVEVLGKLGRAPEMGPIALALTNGPLRAVAAQELPRIVDRLTPEDYGAMPSEAVPALCSSLSGVSVETALVILRALKVIGDGRAIFAVEYAAHNGASPEVREAAINLIPILNRRREESRTSSMLLRPSAASAETESTLLRAAAENADAHEDQLVRAIQ